MNSFIVMQNGTETLASEFQLNKGDKVVLHVSAVEGNIELLTDPSVSLKQRAVAPRDPPTVADLSRWTGQGDEVGQEVPDAFKLQNHPLDDETRERLQAYQRAFNAQARIGAATFPLIAEMPRMTIPLGDVAWHAEYSPDGSLLAAAVDDRIWMMDARTGSRLWQFAGHRDRVSSVAFSPDGKLLVSSGRDGLVHVWDVTSRKQLDYRISRERDIRWIAFANGRLLALAHDQSPDYPIELWSLENGEKLATLLDRRDWLPPQAQLSATSWID